MKLLITIFIVLIVIGIVYWWFIYRPAHAVPTEGSDCHGGLGQIRNGICVDLTPQELTAPGNLLPPHH